MTGPDTPHGRTRDDESERPRTPLPTPSNVVDLGTEVGADPPTGLTPTGRAASEPPPQGRAEWEVVGETDRGSSGGSRRGPPTPESRAPGAEEVDEYVARTYRSNDTLAVVAELPSVHEEDLSTGIDVRSNQLVVSVEGLTVDRIPLPWSSTVVAGVRFDGGVLEAHLEPGEGSGFGADREECA